ncbi:2-polyprenylphenol 6-hydroxylase [Phenylobacterium sp.]|jgi:ubiquinone biosynthesis protein|uniref:2-polyprenylphenol 6-hydroxylase n=1 Tax=Phenylobacterium sp. TaxID=1871053 RepID=UPI002E33B4B4|nr:2-polyprenylphenol 6-hydroxylase [Phenylobacterium sp.]HEX2559830.1 2-polyprenylphenol 6-hydroxylase [Phenylobacterium sp.]
MSGPAAFARLIGAAWMLVRNDALLPREFDHLYAGGVRTLANVTRVAAGPEAKVGRPGERLARALERLGPVAIKLGQLLSTRADIFGGQFAEDLSRLKDRLDPFPTEAARAAVEAELGRPIDSLYATFGGPVAAASLAQAHEATLLDGRPVAVKVLRPGIERRIAEDSEVLALAARIVERWSIPARRLEPRALAATVIRATELELDLRLEAAGADQLGEVMARDAYMRAPKVMWEGVGKRVLTLEWAQGRPLSDPAALEQPGLDRKALADNLTRAFLAQALDHGVFHADLHEGNLFAAPPAQITAVDFGIIGRLGPAERRYLAEILWGFLDRDYERVAQVHFDAGYVPRTHDVALFAQALRAVGEPVFGRAASEVSMSRVLTQLFEITALFDMRLRPELVLLQKTMMTVEGVARRIDPDHDIWAAADPVVRRWMARELSPLTQARRVGEEALATLQALRRRLETEPAGTTVAVVEPATRPRWPWVLLGAALAGTAAWIAALLT